MRAIDNRPYTVICLLAFLPERAHPGRKANKRLAAVGAIINRPFSVANTVFVLQRFYSPTSLSGGGKVPLEKRKPNRLLSYDYSQSGAYFLTVCAKGMRCIFWNADACLPESSCGEVPLSAAGLVIDTAICEVPMHYPGVTVEKYIIMPNHLHMILLLTRGHDMPVSDIPRIVQQFKAAVTKQIGFPVWQKSFHDHIIRNEKEYLAIWEYIDSNPIRWQEDCYYAEGAADIL